MEAVTRFESVFWPQVWFAGVSRLAGFAKAVRDAGCCGGGGRRRGAAVAGVNGGASMRTAKMEGGY